MLTTSISVNSTSGGSTNDDKSNLGAIIGTVLGTCTVILVVIVLLLIAYARRKRRLDKNK